MYQIKMIGLFMPNGVRFYGSPAQILGKPVVKIGISSACCKITKDSQYIGFVCEVYGLYFDLKVWYLIYPRFVIAMLYKCNMM